MTESCNSGVYCKYCKRYKAFDWFILYPVSKCRRGPKNPYPINDLTGDKIRIFRAEDVRSVKVMGSPWPCEPELNLIGRYRKWRNKPIGGTND